MSPAGSCPGWLSASHWRSSSRKASSWGESVRSTAKRALYRSSSGGPSDHRIEERRRDSLVELPPDGGADLLTRLVRGERAAVGAIGGHRVVGVADQDHARAERDRVAGEPVGVAAAVPVLVAVADEREHLGEEVDLGEDLGAHLDVALDLALLRLRERTRLVEDALRHRHLADVVERRRIAQVAQLPRAHSEPP